MRFIHSVFLFAILCCCVLSQTEEVEAQHHEIEKPEIVKKQESELEMRIESLKSQKSKMEDEHKERMSSLKSTLKDLKKEYEEVAKSVTSADTKATRRSKNIALLEKRVKKLQDECKATIASSYLFRKLNHVVFDYVHPFVMEVLLYTEKGVNFVILHVSDLWKKICATEAYIQSVAFVKKYGAMGWEKVKEYWNVVIQFVNTTFHVDVYAAVKTGYSKAVTLIFGAKYPVVCKKVEEAWHTVKEAVKPSALKHYIDTLRNVFQLTSATSPYADLIFYLYIGIWATVIVSLLLSCVYH